MYTELILFLGLLIFGLIPFEKNMVVMEIVKVLSNFAIFVVQPLFYLNGDVNFRNRVQNQGLWKALKKELFQTNSQIQPIMSVSWFTNKYKPLQMNLLVWLYDNTRKKTVWQIWAVIKYILSTTFGGNVLWM